MWTCVWGLLACGEEVSTGLPGGSVDMATAVPDQEVMNDGSPMGTIDGEILAPDAAVDAAPPPDPCAETACGPYGQCADGVCQCEPGYAVVDGACVDVDDAEAPVGL